MPSEERSCLKCRFMEDRASFIVCHRGNYGVTVGEGCKDFEPRGVTER